MSDLNRRLSDSFVRYYVEDLPTDNAIGAVSGGSPGAGPIKTVAYVPVSAEMLADITGDTPALSFHDELAHRLYGHVSHFLATTETLSDPHALGRLLFDAWVEIGNLTTKVRHLDESFQATRRAARRALGLYVAEAEDIDPDDDISYVLNTEQWGG